MKPSTSHALKIGNLKRLTYNYQNLIMFSSSIKFIINFGLAGATKPGLHFDNVSITYVRLPHILLHGNLSRFMCRSGHTIIIRLHFK